jgi:sugar (pentulose or hexulose) kinase
VQLLWGDAPEATHQAFAEAEAAPVGADGAMWLPHLLGSGTPHGDQHSRAALVGLRPEHKRGHIVRALLEGLGFWLRENLEITGQNGGVVAIGGATRSPLWTQIKADICDRPFCVPQLEESVALGAALLAGVGSGTFKDHAEAVASVSVSRDTFEPRPHAVSAYSEWYDQVYRRLYPALRDINHDVDRLSRPPE